MAEARGLYKTPAYGGALGIRFFRWVVRAAGVRPAYFALFFVILYYVIFRRSARRSAAHYLRRRFPQQGPVRRFFSTISYFNQYGRVLIDQGAIGILGLKGFHIDFPERAGLYAMAKRDKGLAILTSHAGGWQSAMGNIGNIGKPVLVQMHTEIETHGLHFFESGGEDPRFRFVSPKDHMGGLLALTQVLTQGGIVAIMGDRAFGGRVREMEFLGAKALFPIAPYRLAAATGAELVALLTVRTGARRYRVNIHNLTEGRDWTSMPRDEAVEQLMARYAAVLEGYVQENPYMWFNFFDFWALEEIEKQPP